MELRAYRFETRELGEAGTFAGYASVFGNVDQHGTIVDRGAFKKTLKENANFLPLLFYHDPMQPVGSFSGEEDEHGLLITGSLDLDIEPGQRVYSGMKKGYIDRMSIGFTVITEAVKDQITHFKELRLWESSLVPRNFASNELALVTDVRAAATGLQRVNSAIRHGVVDELREALADFHALVCDGAEPSEIRAALAEGLTDLRALIVREGPAIATPSDEPQEEAEPGDHSDLLEDMRAIGREVERMLQETR